MYNDYNPYGNQFGGTHRPNPSQTDSLWGMRHQYEQQRQGRLNEARRQIGEQIGLEQYANRLRGGNSMSEMNRSNAQRFADARNNTGRGRYNRGTDQFNSFQDYFKSVLERKGKLSALEQLAKF